MVTSSAWNVPRPPRFFDVRCGFHAGGVVDVSGDDLRSALGQRETDRPAYAAAAAADYRYPTIQLPFIWHIFDLPSELSDWLRESCCRRERRTM